ncbi:MAG: substrate-binding domain-containing protein [Lachnospiraceae bacterium]|jgi:methyl-galactoside transport system substrate-binding protein|nr:galactose ABC transporter substrate-binding protein [uncultured Acetatifactor sp.]MCI8931523.1 substrate-binding domain-containing protein [Lachnospiraceae bacterium]
MKLKKVIAIAMASAMVFGLAACGNSAAPAATETPAEEAPAEEAPAEETPAEEAPAEEEAAAEEAAAEDAEAAAETAGAGGNIGVCIYKFDDAFMTTYRNALQEILEGKGYTVTFMDGKNDQAEQNNQINNFIAQKVDALIINPVMTSAADQIIATVKDAGVPTVLINREPTADQMSAYDKLVYVGCDARQSGTMQGELILDTANKGDINGDGKVSYIMIQGDPENVDAQYRTEFSVKALTDAGMEVEELDLQRGDWDRNKGQEIAQNDLAKFGEDIEVIFCNNDDMAIGALQAIQAAGRKVNEDIYLVGVDALDAALNEVAAGNMTGTVLNDAQGQAEGAVAAMEELLGGKTYAAGEQSIYVDYVKVTPDNVADFQ